MSELPGGWTECLIGEVSKVVAGGTPPSKDPTNFSPLDTGLPWITPADLSGYKQIYISRGARNLSEKGFDSCSAVKMPAGSVLFSSRAPIGYVAIAANEVTTNQGFKSFVLPDEINSHFMYYYLKSVKPVAEAMATGTTFKELSGSATAQLPFVLAPINEQKRIADKLDAVLARVDACRDRLDRVPVILKRFRQSVLAAATSGKLTEDWHAEQTIASHPTTWQIGTLANLLVGKPRNGYSPRAVEYPTSVKSLTLTATTSGRFKGEHFKYIDEKIPPDSHLWLQPGDILIQRANTLESVGISAVYDGPSSTFIYPDLMMKAKANNLVETKFLHYLLLSEPVRRHFRDNATGTAGNMPKINQPTVLTAPVTWPSREEQAEIVRRVESLFDYADRLEARFATARAQTERLTPALLAKAFRGELVPQDPSDEPASELLERIRAQHSAPGAGKPRHNKRLQS